MKSQILTVAVILVTLASGFTAHAIPSVPKPATPAVQEDSLKHNVNIFPGDSRKDLNSSKHPWTAIGRIVTPTGGPCSATLVGADLILTAAHCVLDPEGKLKRGKYEFQAGYNNGRMFASAGVLRAWYGSRQGHHTDNDWALLQLDARLGDRLGWMGVKHTDSDSLAGNTDVLYLAAYGTDYNQMNNPYWQKDCSFRGREVGVEYVMHDCSMSRGSSGGAMFTWDATRRALYIVAVNVGERRSGEVSERVPYFSREKANIAIPTQRFFSTLKELLGRQPGA